ncbi:MAG: cysteine--tRNA ligase [Lentisphaerae bacterium GWF2_44_16]|nr:MAG: cysteine--tRNA ligase [Lentisphaerae bacterium GWF2_44_16]
MPLYFFNTMNRSREEFRPLKENEAGMYTCGPTVYNFAHIGNFRAYIFEDLLRRTLKYFGYKVIQVMNLTDVDDKTIRDSQKAGISLNEYTAKYKKAFFEDLAFLNVEPAEHYPAATDHIPEMIKLIQMLQEKGFAYKAEDGSIYYSIAKFPEYGKLAKIDMENQKSGVRVKTDEYAKDAVADFALWKAWDEKDGDVAWESPWGKGRPGWHIECSAMSMKYLGNTFDIHTGGIDNMFPHHEDEIAQSEAANGCRYVNYWLHCAHLIVNGEKMSKSLGNFFTLKDLKEKNFTGPEIRWILLSAHYRKKLNFTFEDCEKAKALLKKFADFFLRLKTVEKAGKISDKMSEIVKSAQNSFKDAIGDDLNISEAVAALFGLEREANKLMDSGEITKEEASLILEQFKDFDKVLGVLNVDGQEEKIPEEIEELAGRRQAARKSKNFAEADAIRDELKRKGWVLEDTAKGPRLKKIS